MDNGRGVKVVSAIKRYCCRKWGHNYSSSRRINHNPKGNKTTRGRQDEFVWTGCPNKVFIVQSCYRKLMQRLEPIILGDRLKREIQAMWEVLTSTKIKVFTWRLLLGRLPTRIQLIKRTIISNTEEKWCTLLEVIHF